MKKRTTQGFALIEVLVAVFVLAIGILGAAAIQTLGLQADKGAYFRSQAMFLANDIVDRMRVNRTALDSYLGVNSATDSTTNPDCADTSSGCSPSQLADSDIAYWVDQVKNQSKLPNVTGTISELGAGDNVTVTITWTESDWVNGVRTDGVAQSYAITAAINKDAL